MEIGNINLYGIKYRLIVSIKKQILYQFLLISSKLKLYLPCRSIQLFIFNADIVDFQSLKIESRPIYNVYNE